MKTAANADHHETSIIARCTNGVAQPVPIDETVCRQEKQTRERGFRNIPRQRREKNDDHGNGRSGEHSRRAGDGSSLEVDGRARERARSGQALEEAAGKVGKTFGEALPIVIEGLARCARDGFRNRQGLKQAEERDGERAA